MSAAPKINTLIKCYVEVTKGPHLGQKFSFDKKSLFIGRGSENEICLANDPRISRQHAEIKQMDGHFYVINLSQRNFILVDGEKVETEKLGQGVIIQIGESEMKFTADFPTNTNAMVKTNEDATVAVSSPASLLQPQLPPNFTPDIKPVAVSPQMPTPKPASSAAPLQTHQQVFLNSTPRSSPHEARRPMQTAASEDNSRLKFYFIVALVAGLIYFFLFSGSKTKKTELAFRGSSEIQEDLEESAKTSKALKEKIEKMGDVTYKRAQENYVKGFREFRQANYSRAKDYFQIVLSLDPDNELAKRYYRLSMVKFDELLQANFNQGLKYREKKNYRMCKSSFANVLVMIQNNKSHPIFPQADQFFNECRDASSGRF